MKKERSFLAWMTFAQKAKNMHAVQKILASDNLYFTKCLPFTFQTFLLK